VVAVVKAETRRHRQSEAPRPPVVAFTRKRALSAGGKVRPSPTPTHDLLDQASSWGAAYDEVLGEIKLVPYKCSRPRNGDARVESAARSTPAEISALCFAS